MTSETHSDSSDIVIIPARQPGRRVPVLPLVGALVCLIIAAAAAGLLAAEQGRQPTAAQRAAAAATAVARRWRTWPAGRIFPVSLPYSTSLLTSETATRVAISPQDSCASALSAAAAADAARSNCRAGLRATYLDQLDGLLYTVGVLAFPGQRQAASFYARLPGGAHAVTLLRALAVPGTASARFSQAARQWSTARRAGPFVVVAVGGYADGEPAGPGQQARPSVFSPAGQLAAEVAAPLARSVTVRCGTPEWSC